MQRTAPFGRIAPALVTVLATIPLIVGLCVIYVRAEHPAYVWDYGAYWQMFQLYGGLIANDTPGWTTRLLQEIATQDYNPFATVPLYPFFWAFGGERTTYLAAVTLTYLLPATLIATILATQTADRSRHFFCLFFVMAVTYMPFWVPTLRGMVDICGLIFLGLATLLVLNTDFLSRRPILTGALFGVLIWTPFLFRRWYAYSLICLILLTFLFGLVTRLRAGHRPLRALISIVLPLAIAGILCVALLLTFQKDLVVRVLSTSYADLYVAYQAPLGYHLELLAARVGGYYATLIVVGVLFALYTRNIGAIFCALCAVTTYLFFIRTQQVGTHHFLPMAFWLFVPYTFGAYQLSQRLTFLPNSIRILPFAILSVAILIASVTVDFRRSNVAISFFVPEAVVPPLRLENYSEYERLVGDLHQRPDVNEKFSVFASSFDMSDSLIVALAPDLLPDLNYASQVAEIDPFHFDNLRSRYVISTDPPLTHLAPGSQAIITVPAEQVLSGKGIGAAYKQIGTPYTIGGGAKAYLMRRERPITAQEFGAFADALGVYYPAWRDGLRKSMALQFAARIDQHDSQFGQVNQQGGPNTLFIHPGANQPTGVSLAIDEAIATRPAAVVLSIPESILKTCPNADGVAVSMTLDGAPLWDGSVLPGEAQTVPFPPRNGTLDITVDKKTILDCDHLYAEFQIPQ
ncbi:hypothetical protein MKI84_07740 [Ancylobacter sp. A5.8]|uniref:hypothetical protein n=1 Tax=Ancylobacter gelatini TaxID=2919920 RepID=UPI001F4D683C|nr:hypothetical protein [Ancylobacter gelatini]MCJ8142807.1 hypothetical protein [Ancylobacter gelatini]